MGIITSGYKKSFLIRYDKDPAIPYFSVEDFPGMKVDARTFNNSHGDTIHYFFYSYDEPKSNMVVLFLPGMGPGHTAYFAEIDALCKAGYKVLTLDYTGCGESSGETMYSVNAPTRDVNELLDLLKIKEEIVLIGHSLGGYTALNIVNLRKDIKKAVVISGFLSIANEMLSATKSHLVAWRVKKYEEKLIPEYGRLDNIEYLLNTKDQILYIQSDDDVMVAFKYALGIVKELGNPNIKCLELHGKYHNPLYTYDAVHYMIEVFSEYNRLIKEKILDTTEKQIEFMSNKSIRKMTEIDQEVLKPILEFIK